MKVVFCAYPYIKDNQKIWTSTHTAFIKGYLTATNKLTITNFSSLSLTDREQTHAAHLI
ncbi:MAG: hypothetical protein KME38_12930 [Spirirestis rafaelensis WJT71-NPBG6]|jgi:hypothetical protein|nr:hypothetical protein [Spirirestis rafaelensis WJT71-NPBG6]